MQFTRLTDKNINQIKDYFIRSEISFCDLSVGTKYMWREEYVIDFCIINDTLIMKEKGPDYEDVFYYPIGNDVESGLVAIEKYCRENNLQMEFTCIDDNFSARLEARYNEVEVLRDRDWCDYIYTAEQFKTYAGKKLSGQRNHVNKFKKTYPEYLFKRITIEDEKRLNEFLDEYATSPFLTEDAREEIELTRDYLKKIDELSQLGGYLEVDGKIVAMSIGERLGDTLIVHVEKGLTIYSGVYPTMAQEFVKAFATEGVKFVNREEDCGDEGLRRSKTQYHPIEIKSKNAVKVKTLFDKIVQPLELKTDRLTINELTEEDKQDYHRLYTDQALNQWWGYDYNEDLGDKHPTPEYFFEFQKSLKDKGEEISFAVRELSGDKLVGELVLHNFDYFGGVEIGFRFFPEYQGKGYATESANALIEYAFSLLGAKKLKAKCYKQNIRSQRLIERLGFRKTVSDQKYFYFEKYENTD